MSAMSELATELELEWTVNRAGLLAHRSGNYMIGGASNNRHVLLTLGKGDVTQISVFNTLAEAVYASENPIPPVKAMLP